MMNYIQPDILKRYQVDYFDSWVGAFGEIQNSMELAPTGISTNLRNDLKSLSIYLS